MGKDKQIKEILKQGWKINVSFSSEESYCFIFSPTGKELGFARMKGYEQGVLETAYERALTKVKQLEERKQKVRESQPLLYDEEG